MAQGLLLPCEAGEEARRGARRDAPLIKLRLVPFPCCAGGEKILACIRDHVPALLGERLKAPRTSAGVSAWKANSRPT